MVRDSQTGLSLASVGSHATVLRVHAARRWRVRPLANTLVSNLMSVSMSDLLVKQETGTHKFCLLQTYTQHICRQAVECCAYVVKLDGVAHVESFIVTKVMLQWFSTTCCLVRSHG